MEQTSSANSTPKQYTVGMGLKADYNTPAGTYTSSAIVAEYVARPISYSISYNKGGISGTPTSGTIPATQSDVVSGTSVTLSSTTPSGIVGYTFKGWCNTNTTSNGTLCNGTTTPTFTAGGNYGIDQTTSNTVTLYALWSAIDYTITVNAGAGISTLTASGWTGTGTATLTKTYHIGDTINLTTITPTRKTGYTGTAYALASGSGSISSSTYTVGAGNGTITIKATGLNTPTCTIQGGATKVYNRSATTLTATDNSENYDTSSVNITYSFGYASNGTNDLASFSTAQTGTTLSIPAAAFRGARYYGVKVVVTDKTDSTITNTCTSGTGTSTGTTVANRTTMTLVNSRINFDATTNGGTLSGTSPVYVYYNGTATYSSRTGSTARAIPTATKDGYNFTGWWTAASGGSKVINADGTVVASVSSWTNASKQWIRTSTSTSATANMLYAQFEVACTAISGTMQAFSPTTTTCESGTLTDARDSKTYTVKKINGQWWMTQNLRYLGDTGSATKTMTMGNGNSNVANKSITLYSINKSNAGNFNAYTDHCDATNSYNYACVYDSGSTSTGVWYNYYAASAGTISGSSNSTVATSDICPANWHLPTGPNTTTNTDLNKLIGNITAGYQTSTTGTTAFDAVSGGSYSSVSLYNTAYGYWWSATAYSTDAAGRYSLAYSSSDNKFYGDGDGYRYNGRFVRCVMKPTMQNTTVADLSEGEEKTVIDARDGKNYTIKKINGQLWMTQNLRYLGDTGSAAKIMTIGNNNSNVANTSIDLYSLKSGDAQSFNAYSSATCGSSSTAGYNNACVYDSGDTTKGVWYNYYAATAGTISGSSNSTAASQDICPKNWHLPTGPSTTANTDFNKLVGNTTSGWQNPTAGLTAFSAVAGGYYLDGSLNGPTYGYWWSATARNATSRIILLYNFSNGQFIGSNTGAYVRYLGYFVRCVRST